MEPAARMRSPRRPILLLALTLAAGLPLVALLLAAFGMRWFFPALLPESWTLESWRDLGGGRLLVALAESVGLGLAVGLGATSLAVPIGRALARAGGGLERLGAAAAFLPVAVPPIALAAGLQLALLRLGLGGTRTAVFLGHLVPATGYLALYFLGVFRLLDPDLEATARTLGATPRQVVQRVLAPLLARPLREAVALGFLISWAQVPLTLVLGGGRVRTLAVEIVAYVQAGQDRHAATAGLLLIVPAVLALAIARRSADRTTVVVA
jgi:putative spermidine/putrescine transport system permease protein